jgi:peptide subunit release factor RF-3
VEPLPIQVPIGSGKSFRGIVDLVGFNLMLWDWDKWGRDYKTIKLTKETAGYLEVFKPAVEARLVKSEKFHRIRISRPPRGR